MISVCEVDANFERNPEDQVRESWNGNTYCSECLPSPLVLAI